MCDTISVYWEAARCAFPRVLPTLPLSRAFLRKQLPLDLCLVEFVHVPPAVLGTVFAPQDAISNFISLVGDKPIEEITREDARTLHKYWLDRVVPDDKTQRRYSPNSANKQIGSLRAMYSAYFELKGNGDRKHPFSRLSFEESDGRKRMSFSNEWIQGKILAPGALAGLNDQARGITLAQVETGCRPGELCNIVPEDIHLDALVPYIHVKARTDPNDARDIKTVQSDREIPLVGVTLEVFKRHPNGFPRYKTKRTHTRRRPTNT